MSVDIPEGERFKPGSVVEVINDLTDSDGGYDARLGSKYVVGAYVTLAEARQNDDDEPFYQLEPVPGSGRWGEEYAPHEALKFIRTAEEQAELMKPVTTAEALEYVQDGLMSGGFGPLDVNETTINQETLTVEFAGRRRGGAGFWGTVKLTHLGPADD